MTVKSLTEESITKFDPFGTILIVGDSVYPIPGLIIFTSLIFPSLTTALSFAPIPVPIPTSSKSGADVYSFPPNLTSHETIFPFKVIAFNSAPTPFKTFILGFFSKFNIFEP